MPATEQTWRDQKFMHLLFGITAVVMLASTVWMLVADHRREWKQYQRQYRQIEVWNTNARIQQELATTQSEEVSAIAADLVRAQSEVPASSDVEEFLALVEANEDDNTDIEGLRSSYEALAEKGAASSDDEGEGDAEVRNDRSDFIEELRGVVTAAKLREDLASQAMKFRKADFEVARSSYQIAIGEAAAQAELERLKAELDEVGADVDDMTLEYEQANTYRTDLEKVLARLTEEEDALADAHTEQMREMQRLESSLGEQQVSLAERLLEMPVLDAFGRPLKINQIWLPDLTVDYNFKGVARFDRCTTCHLAIDKTAPGSATRPGYPVGESIVVELATPDTRPDGALDTNSLYGLEIAERGMLPGKTSIEVVWPGSVAARAGLRMGDMIEFVNDVKILDPQMAVRELTERVDWGVPQEVTVQRGLPHPFSSHPRLDLFVGSLSPHKMMEFGCTTCHEGQGSATAFKWASHTPNTPQEESAWADEHGWFDNHHWIFPMQPERFQESRCLSCHHEVEQLAPSERFPEPPAPQLTKGYDTIRQYGCFGCHEVNGYDGPDSRVGPDLRSEPNYFAAAQQLLIDPALVDSDRALAEKVIKDPTDTGARKMLSESLLAGAGENGGDEAVALSAESIELATMLGEDNETPGTLRKVGPSLRFLAHKVDFDFVYQWIQEPKRFRPTTRMPQFFGLWDHLKAYDDEGHGENGHVGGGHGGAGEGAESHGQPTSELELAQRYERVELAAMTHYLLDSTQPFEYLEHPPEVTEAPSAERGRQLFETRGCLACHQHKDFPDAPAMEQGPELSRIASKLAGEKGERWLYSWIKKPNRYHVRTKMPDLYLEPIANADGTVTDPADDIAAFLFQSSEPWSGPTAPPLEEIAEDLDALALEYLKAPFTTRQAETYLANGIPEQFAAELKGDEVLLVGEGQMTPQKKLSYVGRRSLSKYGCAACHDIPGFEDARPIGTALTEWGRKDPSKLAFEQIVRYLEQSDSLGENHTAHGLHPEEMDPDVGYFVQSLLHHSRNGFIWQKLREPRSYDYRTTESKGYNERLRMPQFPFEQEDVEAVITFVLGLVADPPVAEYVYSPNDRQEAIVNGRKVLDRFNCAGCHALEMDKWEFEYDPDEFESPATPDDFDFVYSHFTMEQLAASTATDARGLGTAVVEGMPVVDGTGALMEDEDDDGNPVYFFELWRPKAINGEVWEVAQQLILPEQRIIRQTSPRGGDLARYLYPKVLAAEQATNPNAKASDAWGWVPPPLLREGHKVQTDWLHEFLLNPYPIRPSVVLRMPKFNMSSQEARMLVDYFAAVDGAEYPYESRPLVGGPANADLDAALKVVTNRQFCVQCHRVGDFVPEGSLAAQAPNLDQIHKRFRPEFLRQWLANPKSLLPYTGMPVNFPKGKEAAQDLYPGSSVEQIDGIVELLLNYDDYMKRSTSIAELVPEAPAADAAGGEAGGDAGAE